MKDLHVYCIPLERLENSEEKHSAAGQDWCGDVVRMGLARCGAQHRRDRADSGKRQRQEQGGVRGHEQEYTVGEGDKTRATRSREDGGRAGRG